MTYQFVFCYTTDISRAYSEQIEHYILDYIFTKKGLEIHTNDEILDEYIENMTLYVSTNENWPIPIGNTSVYPDHITNNSYDLVLLHKHHFFNSTLYEPYSSADYIKLLNEY